MSEQYPDDHYDPPPVGNCAECEYSEDLPPGIVFGVETLYCNRNHYAVEPCRSCKDWEEAGQ